MTVSNALQMLRAEVLAEYGRGEFRPVRPPVPGASPPWTASSSATNAVSRQLDITPQPPTPPPAARICARLEDLGHHLDHFHEEACVRMAALDADFGNTPNIRTTDAYRWKAVLNLLDITFDGRLGVGGK